MAIATEPSLVDQLYHVEGKAEIVHGRIIHLMPTGGIPALAAFAVAISLHLYVKSHGLDGVVLPDNAGFIVRLPHRQSFSPDVAYYVGPPASMKLFEGAPRLTVEVRSEGEYGPSAEREIARQTA